MKKIVKVQISQLSSDNELHVLAYNKDKSIWYEDIATDEVLAMMNFREKAFFYYEIDGEGEVILGEEAPWQEW